MNYIDFTKQRLDLHNNIKRAIANLMQNAKVKEIDLLADEEHFDSGWLIRNFSGEESIEEVQVAKLKLDGDTLLYIGKTEYVTDEDWLPLEIQDNVISATIDSVYEAVYQRIGK